MTLSDGEEIAAEKVLVAAGRQGRIEGLGLERLGIEADRRGIMKVDEHFRTTCPSVYAVGDLVGFPALASTGMDQGRIAVYHAFQLHRKDALARHLPLGVYTIPEVGMVGETEQAARARGEDVETGRALLRDNARGRINGAASGLVKLVFRASDRKLLGVHILGEQATETVHIGMMALQAGLEFDAFVDAVFNFPTLSEAYKYAAFDGLGRMAQRDR
jgi:NAD(P) transhydrogenase